MALCCSECLPCPSPSLGGIGTRQNSALRRMNCCPGGQWSWEALSALEAITSMGVLGSTAYSRLPVAVGWKKEVGSAAARPCEGCAAEHHSQPGHMGCSCCVQGGREGAVSGLSRAGAACCVALLGCSRHFPLEEHLFLRCRFKKLSGPEALAVPARALQAWEPMPEPGGAPAARLAPRAYWMGRSSPDGLRAVRA